MARADRVSDAAPTSFAGSLTRVWGRVGFPVIKGEALSTKVLVGPLLVFYSAIFILLAWTLVLCWYFMFGLLVVPYRVFRKSSRRTKKLRAELERVQPAQPQSAQQPAQPTSAGEAELPRNSGEVSHSGS